MSIAELRQIIKDLPDDTEIEVYSGSVECFVSYSINTDDRDDQGNPCPTYLCVNAEN